MKKTFSWKGKDKEVEVKPLTTDNWEECASFQNIAECGHWFREDVLALNSPNYLINVRFSPKCREILGSWSRPKDGKKSTLLEGPWVCEWCYDMISQTPQELGYSFL
tara:strand:- start:86 stop:406 length:321 start_codon:yes stop_codon:yes gene_type:complete